MALPQNNLSSIVSPIKLEKTIRLKTNIKTRATPTISEKKSFHDLDDGEHLEGVRTHHPTDEGDVDE